MAIFISTVHGPGRAERFLRAGPPEIISAMFQACPHARLEGLEMCDETDGIRGCAGSSCQQEIAPL